MWRVASASERAATAAAEAAKLSNKINIRQQVYDLRQQAVIDASNAFDRISNLSHEFIGQGYELQRSLDLAQVKQNLAQEDINIIGELNLKLSVTDCELREFTLDLGDRGKSILEQAMAIATHDDFDKVMVRLLKLKVDVNYAFTHVRARYANIQGLLSYGRDGA